MYFRGIPVVIVTRTEGNNFGTVATATAMGQSWDSDVCPLGYETAAIDQAKERAASWLKPFTWQR
jgi:hypothetical protein